ncbi:hypothetical protein NT01EI_1136 [Edwardsiella ictaluri 93-146]|uniref:Uncharacterized protein n=1 Tax=Edwardsiella ictaluri (strain 93-146) TaxID=634503 RepID=C5BHK2_EDWI9|nr:hypothetical protein NT01EI_1136 [Edwardsiella ictaluri 93-146]
MIFHHVIPAISHYITPNYPADGMTTCVRKNAADRLLE